MSTIKPGTETFVTSKGYTITNRTLNVNHNFFIKSIDDIKPIGVDEFLFAIQFRDQDNNHFYWYYADTATRDADLAQVEGVIESSGANGATSDTTAANQVAIITVLEELKTKVEDNTTAIENKVDTETIYCLGYDSSTLENVNPINGKSIAANGTDITTSSANFQYNGNSVTFDTTDAGIGGFPTIVIGLDKDFSAESMIDLFFEAEVLGNPNIGRPDFDLINTSTGEVLATYEVPSNYGFSLTKQDVQLTYINTTNIPQVSIRLNMQFQNQTFAYNGIMIQGASTSATATDQITKVDSFENGLRVKTEYFDVDNNLVTIQDKFIKDNNKENTVATQDLLMALNSSVAQESTLKEVLTEVTKGDLDKIKSASDYKREFGYLDANTSDRRVETITHTSLGLAMSVTETFVYSGSAGDYYVTSITTA